MHSHIEQTLHDHARRIRTRTHITPTFMRISLRSQVIPSHHPHSHQIYFPSTNSRKNNDGQFFLRQNALGSPPPQMLVTFTLRKSPVQVGRGIGTLVPNLSEEVVCGRSFVFACPV